MRRREFIAGIGSLGVLWPVAAWGQQSTIPVVGYLMAATHEIDLFLREGCHLHYASTEDDWYAVPRRGTTTKVNLGSKVAQATILQFTLDAAKLFREKWPEELEHKFDPAEAKKLLAKKEEDNPDEDDK